MDATHTEYLVIDLEATCDDAAAVPRDEMEIIEIGAVLVDGRSLEPTAEFQTFVRPVRHPRLTAFCTKLTTIEQHHVDDAPTFPEALAELRGFMPEPRPLFCSWGAYDRNQFGQDARFHGVELPFGDEHFNVKRGFSRAVGSDRRFGMASALRRVGLPLEGTHHRALDDARNIAKLLRYVVGSPGTR